MKDKHKNRQTKHFKKNLVLFHVKLNKFYSDSIVKYRYIKEDRHENKTIKITGTWISY